jgi:histidyl-tRNA synthetase
MKQANSSNADFAIIIGEEELANDTVSIKHMKASAGENDNKQIQVKRSELLHYLNHA